MPDSFPLLGSMALCFWVLYYPFGSSNIPGYVWFLCVTFMKFGYTQPLGVQNDTLVNSRVQKLKRSTNCHNNRTALHQSYFWEVF